MIILDLFSKLRVNSTKNNIKGWTKIEQIIVTYKHQILDPENAEWGRRSVSTSVVIDSQDINQDSSNRKDMNISANKCAEIKNMILEAEQSNPFMEMLTIKSTLTNPTSGTFLMEMAYTFGHDVAIYVSKDGNRLGQVDFIGTVKENRFYLGSIRINEIEYRGQGIGENMFRMFGIALPFLEYYYGQTITIVEGTIGEGSGDDPKLSIPFYNKLSDMVIPFGRKLHLSEKLQTTSRRFKYQIQEN